MVAAPEANEEAVVAGAGRGVEVAAAATRHRLRRGRMEQTQQRTNEKNGCKRTHKQIKHKFAVKTKMGKERDVSTKQNFPSCVIVHRGGKTRSHEAAGWNAESGIDQRVVRPGGAKKKKRGRVVSRAIMSFVCHVAHV